MNQKNMPNRDPFSVIHIFIFCILILAAGLLSIRFDSYSLFGSYDLHGTKTSSNNRFSVDR